jgi:putative ATP-dependent endonuclease of OLD family
MQDQWKLFHEDERYRDITVGFSSEDLNEILKRVELRFKPTVEEKDYTVDQLGDGLRSLFYLSLVSSVLELEEKLQSTRTADGAGFARENYTPPVLTILAIEEPENHLSPQLLGRVIENLTKTAGQSNADVILSTHTPAILRRVPPEQIRHLRIDEKKQMTVVSSINLREDKDEEYKYVKEAVMAFPELYFARLVILGEGDSEELVIPRILKALGYSLDRSQVSIVPLGGRHVNHFWKLLRGLKIPYVTLLDLDRERHGGGWGRIKYALQQLINLGADRQELLRVKGGGLADLDKMHTWNPTRVTAMDGWIERLEEYNVFFSYPLDLDFAMLEAFPATYKTAFGQDFGPKIPDKTKAPTTYKKRLEEAISSVLKDHGGKGTTYKDYDQDLFFWYRYLFLGRGKPATHIAALAELDDEELKQNAPPSLKRLCDRVEQLLRKGK